jgi:hypothetical protein
MAAIESRKDDLFRNFCAGVAPVLLPRMLRSFRVKNDVTHLPQSSSHLSSSTTVFRITYLLQAAFF